MIRIGVIGVGKMGMNHVKILSEMRGVKLVGISDVNEQLVLDVAQDFGLQAFTDHRGLLECGLDAVSVVTPTTFHCQVAIDALEAGCHILVEKPISLTIDEGLRMIAKAREKGRKMLVGHVERHNPAVKILKEIIDDGILGNIVSISSKRVGPYQPRITDSGIILDLAPHDIDIISYLYNDRVREVYTIAGKTFHHYEDHASIMLKFGRGTAGVIETSWLPPHRVRKLNVVGENGVADLDFIQQRVVVYDKNWAREANVTKQEPLRNELAYFIDIIRDDIDPSMTAEDGLHALAVALSAVESYRQSRTIKVPKPQAMATRRPDEKVTPIKTADRNK